MFFDKLNKLGLTNKVITESDLKRILNGTPAQRYGLINKAIKKGEFVQLKRGTYFLANKYQSVPISQFYIASHLLPHSYVSFESALSYHGWIPEKVTVVSSVIHEGRTRSFQTAYGEFSYTYIPLQQYEFLTGVQREIIHQQPFLIASPIRALFDLIYIQKLNWEGIEFLTDSLRIDEDNIKKINRSDLQDLKGVYRSKRVLNYLNKLEKNI